MTPIAASIPCTAEVGKISARIPDRTNARQTCNRPAITLTPRAS